jgi:hypothetical protein
MSEIESAADAIAIATDRDGWLAAMDDAGEEAGYFQTVGRRHWAYFADESPTLLVGFETVDSARARPGQRPVVQRVAERHGWSHLTLIADGPTFWRDKAVWAWMDRLVDDAFLEDFDRVLFYGAGPGGYAAAAYAVAAPGATVLLAAPRATMAPTIAGWDPRDRPARKLDFTSRYGYAPDMIEGTARVFLAYDPMEPLDAMHAALFRGPHVTPLPLPRAGAGVEATLQRLDVLDGLIEAAAKGTLTRADVAQAWRKRRDDATYLKATLAQAAQRGHPLREKMVCRSVVSRLKMPRFARRLAELEGKGA